MIELTKLMQIILGMMALALEPDIAPEDMEYLQSQMRCCLVACLAEATGKDEAAVKQFLKPLDEAGTQSGSSEAFTFVFQDRKGNQ